MPDGYRVGNFLYPYARALMLGASNNGARQHSSNTVGGIGWEESGNPYRIMLLNAGVGTNIAYGFNLKDGSGPTNAHGSFGVSGYAYNPVVNDSATLLRAADASNSVVNNITIRFQDASGDNNKRSAFQLNPLIKNFAGAPVTCIGDIPPTHRTYQAAAPWSSVTDFSYGVVPHYFGGTANTFAVTGCAITYNGVADADDVVNYVVPNGAAVSAFVLYRFPSNHIPGGTITSGSAYGSTRSLEDNSILVAYFDSATGLPVNGNGGDITIVWDNGINRIFRI